jgi:hypothetical protein
MELRMCGLAWLSVPKLILNGLELDSLTGQHTEFSLVNGAFLWLPSLLQILDMLIESAL